MKKKVLVLTGPTGIGKSVLSLLLSSKLNNKVSIINSDSVQIISCLNIGSNKSVPNINNQLNSNLSNCYQFNLINCRDNYSVNNYYDSTISIINSVHNKNEIPLIVGGSMYYIRWLLYGKPFNDDSNLLNSVDNNIVSRVNILNSLRELSKSGETGIMDYINNLNVSSNSKEYIHNVFNKSRNNLIRLSRAIEISILLNGPPPLYNIPSLSEYKNKLEYDFRCFSLFPTNRLWLSRQLDYRCELMIQDGLIEETLDLMYNHKFNNDCSAASSIGYKQTIQFIQEASTYNNNNNNNYNNNNNNNNNNHNHKGFDNSVELFLDYIQNLQNSTRPYVRKQLSWFRNEPIYQFVPIQTPEIPLTLKETLNPLIHYPIQEVVWENVVNYIVREFNLSYEDYWDKFMNDSEFQTQQHYNRESTRNQNNERAKQYQSGLFLYNSIDKIQSLLFRVQKFQNQMQSI